MTALSWRGPSRAALRDVRDEPRVAMAISATIVALAPNGVDVRILWPSGVHEWRVRRPGAALRIGQMWRGA
jgi:hypothetical protein